MENEHKLREQQIALTLFQKWLHSDAAVGVDRSALGRSVQDLGSALNRPFNVVVIGTDPEDTRRFTNLLTGARAVADKYQTDRFLPISMRLAAEPEVAMFWWDQPDDKPFDGSVKAVESEVPDMVELRQPMGLPYDVRLIEMANGVGAKTAPLMNYALGQYCEQVVWVSSAERWKSDSRSPVWKNVPAKLRRAAVIVMTGEDGDLSSDIPDGFTADVDKPLSLDAAEAALASGREPDWVGSGAGPVIDALMARMEEIRGARLDELSPKVMELIEPMATPKFHAAVTEALEEAIAQEKAITAEHDEQELEDTVKAVTSALASDGQPQEASHAEPELNQELAKDVRSIWLEELTALGDNSSPAAVIENLKRACTRIIDVPEVEEEIQYDCRSVLGLVSQIEIDGEDTEFLLSCVLCQMANTIGQVTEAGSLEQDRDVKKIMKRFKAAA